jgi:hypothetical protein
MKKIGNKPVCLPSYLWQVGRQGRVLKISGVSSCTKVEEEMISFFASVGWVGFPGEDVKVIKDLKVVN